MSSQMVQIGYPSPPNFDAKAIAARAQELIGSDVELADVAEPLMFFHMGHLVSYSDRENVPGQTVLLPGSADPADDGTFDEQLQQSWACDDAADRIARCADFPMLTEMLTRALEPADRLKLFHGVLQAVLEHSEPVALIYRHSQQVIAPEDYLRSCSESPQLRAGTINVRLFNISNSDADDKLMDTRGLEEAGLHDLQCHYRGIEPSSVASILFNTGCYIVEHGTVIESGNTVDGHQPDCPWTCQFEDSLVAPERVVLDMNPGAPFSAGIRT